MALIECLIFLKDSRFFGVKVELQRGGFSGLWLLGFYRVLGFKRHGFRA